MKKYLVCFLSLLMAGLAFAQMPGPIPQPKKKQVRPARAVEPPSSERTFLPKLESFVSKIKKKFNAYKEYYYWKSQLIDRFPEFRFLSTTGELYIIRFFVNVYKEDPAFILESFNGDSWTFNDGSQEGWVEFSYRTKGKTYQRRMIFYYDEPTEEISVKLTEKPYDEKVYAIPPEKAKLDLVSFKCSHHADYVRGISSFQEDVINYMKEYSGVALPAQIDEWFNSGKLNEEIFKMVHVRLKQPLFLRQGDDGETKFDPQKGDELFIFSPLTKLQYPTKGDEKRECYVLGFNARTKKFTPLFFLDVGYPVTQKNTDVVAYKEWDLPKDLFAFLTKFFPYEEEEDRIRNLDC